MIRTASFLLVLLIAVFTSIFHQALLDCFLSFIELNFSPDNKLDLKTQFLANILLWIINFTLFFGNFLWFSGKANFLFQLSYKIINFDKLYQFLFGGLNELVHFNKTIFYSTSVISFFLYIYASLENSFVHEGLIETTFSSGFLFGAIAFLNSYILARRLKTNEAWLASFRFIIILLFFFSFVMFGEETSWGQHFFGWQAIGIFQDYNFQGETNIHNFFNPILGMVVYFICLLLLFSFLIFWGFKEKYNNFLMNLLSPHPSLSVLVIFICLSGLSGFLETFENLLALFVLCYSLRILVLLKDKIL